MKKLFYCAAALTTLFFAGSCQRENLEPVANGGVTYEISLPDGPQTKGEYGYAKYDLHYEVYKTADADALAAAPLLFEDTVLMEGNTTTVTLNLLNDQDYTVLFWANKNDTQYFDLTDLRKVGVRAAASNDDNRDAFCGYDQLVQHDGAESKKVTLTRPFAQINVATLVPTVAEIGYDVTPVSSLVKVKNIPVVYNVFTGEPVDAVGEVVYSVFDIPGGNLTVNTTSYTKVAMNYALVPATEDNSATVEVYYEINTVNGTVKNSIPNVPVKKNYRTNIIGNLLTSNATYTIELKPGFEGDDLAHVEVINEGITKNINGDYEVTNAKGLAYAINNLFVNGGTFYVLNSIDMTGVEYDPSTIPTGVTVKLVGQVPAVTRSATEPITITGLEYGALIDVNNGNASFSNIVASGSDDSADVPAFINVNNGNADITNCEASHQSFIGENNGNVTESGNTTPENTPIIKEDNGATYTKVGTAVELVDALKANKDVVFTGDITIAANMSNGYGKTGIHVANGQTIDGGDYTLTVQGAGATWDSGISTKGGLIKNLTVAGSFRGIFITNGTEPVVLENVTVDGPVYTISCDSAGNQTLVATNSTFNGWTSYAKTLGSAKFVNCTFGEGSGYAFCRPYAPTEFVGCEFEEGYEIDSRAKVTLNNCTLAGVPVTSENIKTLVTGNSGNAESPTTVTTADELVAALEANENVFFANDIKIEPASMSNAYGTTGINVKNGQTIDGGGHTLNIKGAGGTWDSGINTTGGLIKNITVTGSFRGIFINHNSDHSEKVVLENVTIDGTVYTISCDQGTNQGFEATNSTFNGWTSYAKTLGSAKFTNCSFGEGSGYAYCRPYAPTEFVDCAFEAGFQMDPVAAVTFENCTIGGVAITAANVATLVTSKLANVTSVNGYTQVDGLWINEGAAIVTSPDKVEAALDNTAINTLYLNEGEYTIEVYTNFPVKESLTIIGTEGTKVKFANQQVRLQLAENFTIKNCEILHMATKSWGMLVFGGRDSGAVNCTVSNCSFKGVGTQGIYINENISGAVYNIENCTFDGDFGAEGAITIQDNANVDFTVNVNGCAFNNIPSTSHEVCLICGNNDFTLNSDVELEVYTK